MGCGGRGSNHSPTASKLNLLPEEMLKSDNPVDLLLTMPDSNTIQNPRHPSPFQNTAFPLWPCTACGQERAFEHISRAGAIRRSLITQLSWSPLLCISLFPSLSPFHLALWPRQFFQSNPFFSLFSFSYSILNLKMWLTLILIYLGFICIINSNREKKCSKPWFVYKVRVFVKGTTAIPGKHISFSYLLNPNNFLF